ncbi:MAG: thioredoxin domain-containing protein [Anaerolineales bacterium]|nr:thioredoxin domain-containing protein [Anaerolineales bacterium]
MTNLLRFESSPYLRQHAENPVHWRPWNEDAWAEARRLDRPVFLSIGYAACHWCHVMAHESFEDEDVADFLNGHFINIKVDREERPDIDSIYMDAVVALTGQGGWPMSVFLTPHGKPFFAGTYFPPRPAYNMPAFRGVLEHVVGVWKEQRAAVEATGEQVHEHLQKLLQSSTPLPLDAAILSMAARRLQETADKEHGGWGGAPKFPQPLAIEFLLSYAWWSGDEGSRRIAEEALHAMARGGLYDQLGGGFHRYTVDANWLTPHFEKMLYDNAQLVRVYTHAWQFTGDDFYRDVAEATLACMLRDFKNGSGAYISSLDADSNGVEGLTYIWEEGEFIKALEEKGLPRWIKDYFGVTPEGNFEGANILTQPARGDLPLPAVEMAPGERRKILESARSHLLGRRGMRTQPARDDKIITGWNGLALTAFAEAARAFSDPKYLTAARMLADFLLERMIVDGKLHRTWREGKSRYAAVLQDHAALGQGLLALYQADAQPRWLHAAAHQADEILAHFHHPDGGFFDTRDDHERLLIRPRKLEDMPIASGSALSADLLLRLHSLTARTEYFHAGVAGLLLMQSMLERAPTAFAAWLSTSLFAVGPRPQIAIITPADAGEGSDLAAVVHSRYLPTAVLAAAPESASFPALLEGRTAIDGKSTAYLCFDMTCQLPVCDAERLADQLDSIRGNPSAFPA